MKHQQVHNLDGEDDEMKEGEANDLSLLPSQKWGRGPTFSSNYGSTGRTKGLIDIYFQQTPAKAGKH